MPDLKKLLGSISLGGISIPVSRGTATLTLSGYEITDEFGRVAESLTTKSGSVYPLRSRQDDAVTTPYLVPHAFSGEIKEPHFEGWAFNVSNRQKGSLLTTSSIASIQLKPQGLWRGGMITNVNAVPKDPLRQVTGTTAALKPS